MSEELATAILELERDSIEQLVEQRLESEDDPLRVLEECRLGMARVGERFQAGEYYLSELILSAELFERAMTLLDPHLRTRAPGENPGKVVLATMRGDIHDLGKNILASLLRAHGFEVHDLGTNVEVEALIDGVRTVRPDFVGFSSLITASFESTRQATDRLEQEGLRANLKLMLGGGVTSPTVRDYIGADFQSLDAMAGVRYCLRAAKENRS